LHFVDSEETAVSGYSARNAFDGNPASMWATQWSNGTALPPHEIQINLGGVFSVSGFRYLPRQDGESYGRIGQYEFYVSIDGVNWGAVAAGVFVSSAVEAQVTFTAKLGQYVRMRALTEVGGYPWTTVAELNVLAATGGSSEEEVWFVGAGDIADCRGTGGDP